jgi:hypothetical protein
VAAQCQAYICGRSFSGTVGSKPAGNMDVSFECCVLSGTGICVRLLVGQVSSPVTYLTFLFLDSARG